MQIPSNGGEWQGRTRDVVHPPKRPFDDSYLLAYSAEHVAYEVDMFFWLAAILGNSSTRLGAQSQADAARVSNVLTESFALHLRNILEFLYRDNPRPTDATAADFSLLQCGRISDL